MRTIRCQPLHDSGFRFIHCRPAHVDRIPRCGSGTAAVPGRMPVLHCGTGYVHDQAANDRFPNVSASGHCLRSGSIRTQASWTVEVDAGRTRAVARQVSVRPRHRDRLTEASLREPLKQGCSRARAWTYPCTSQSGILSGIVSGGWRTACGVSMTSLGTKSGSPTSVFGTSCEDILKWPSRCTGLPKPSPARMQ